MNRRFANTAVKSLSLLFPLALSACVLKPFTKLDEEAQFSNKYGGISAANCTECQKRKLGIGRKASAVRKTTEGRTVFNSKRSRDIISLREQLAHHKDSVRTRAVTSASFLGPAGMIFLEDIRTMAVEDPSKWVRRASIKALERMDGRNSIDIVKRASRDQDKWVRHSANNILARLER